MATNEESSRAYRSMVRELARDIEDGFTYDELIKITDISPILAQWNEAPNQAEGFQDAVDSGEWDQIVKVVTAHCVKLITDDVEQERDQYAIDCAEEAFADAMAEPIDYRVQIRDAQLAAMELK